MLIPLSEKKYNKVKICSLLFLIKPRTITTFVEPKEQILTQKVEIDYTDFLSLNSEKLLNFIIERSPRLMLFYKMPNMIFQKINYPILF